MLEEQNLIHSTFSGPISFNGHRDTVKLAHLYGPQVLAPIWAEQPQKSSLKTLLSPKPG